MTQDLTQTQLVDELLLPPRDAAAGDEPVLLWFEELVSKLGAPADSFGPLEAGLEELQAIAAAAWIPAESLPMDLMLAEVAARMQQHMDSGVFAQVMRKEQALVTVLLQLGKESVDEVHAGVAAQDGSAGAVDASGGGAGAGGEAAHGDAVVEGGAAAGGGADLGAASPVPGGRCADAAGS